MISIVGAGFSGLTLAYHLKKRGAAVRIFEKQDRAGGMLNTLHGKYGIAETAANAILADAEIEKLIEELGVPLAGRRPQRKNRYIFWDRPRRWPLSALTTVKLISTIGQIKLGGGDLRPQPLESVHDWTRRVLNAEFEERLLSPALQGIYAGDPKLLSASLCLGALFEQKSAKGKLRGSIAPAGGMDALMQALRKRLQEMGVAIQFGQEYKFDGLLGSTAPLAIVRFDDG